MTSEELNLKLAEDREAFKKIIETSNLDIRSSVDFEKMFLNMIEAMIQREVDRLNKAKNISLENKISCKLYADTDGYEYQQECLDLWNWSVLEVYQPLREWKDTLTAIPTKEEFLNELDKHKYTVTYPEETA